MSKYTPLGEEINKYLKKLNWSQQELASHSQVARSAISRLMRGKTKPTLETINAIADALSIDASPLIELAGIPLPPQNETLDPAALYIAQQLTKLPPLPRAQAINGIQSMVDSIMTVYRIAQEEKKELILSS
jgi:transcriptional regulator with XRE-family HTH domain